MPPLCAAAGLAVLTYSAVISNHTAPVLCLSIIEPIIRDFPPDSPFTKCLLLGLAFGCNFGGMMTPISSMQARPTTPPRPSLANSLLQAPTH